MSTISRHAAWNAKVSSGATRTEQKSCRAIKETNLYSRSCARAVA